MFVMFVLVSAGCLLGSGAVWCGMACCDGLVCVVFMLFVIRFASIFMDLL